MPVTAATSEGFRLHVHRFLAHDYNFAGDRLEGGKRGEYGE